MKYLEKLARKYISNIDEIAKELTVVRELENARIKQLVKNATTLLSTYMDVMEKKMKLDQRFEVGDEAILNKYSIGVNAYNHWDSGAKTILENIGSDKIIFVKIDSIYISHEYSETCIDSFIDSLDIKSLETYTLNHNLIEHYKVYMKDRLYSETLGMYINLKFTIQGNHEFKPQWGLNQSSFLKLGTKDARRTKKLWKREIRMNSIRRELKKEQDKWNDDRNKHSLIKITHY